MPRSVAYRSRFSFIRAGYSHAGSAARHAGALRSAEERLGLGPFNPHKTPKRLDFVPAGEEDSRLALTDGRTGTFVRLRDQQGDSRLVLGVNDKSHAGIEVRDAERTAAVFGYTSNGLGMMVGNRNGGDHRWLGRRNDGHCGVGFFFPNGEPMGGLTSSDEGAGIEFLDLDGQVLLKEPRK
jgi:hypothetical protein